MSIKFLKVDTEVNALAIAAKVKTLTELSKLLDIIDEQPAEIAGFYYVKIVSEYDYSADIGVDAVVSERPDVAHFNYNLTTNKQREEDGREMALNLVTFMDDLTVGYTQSQITGLFKILGWYRALLKQGYFKCALYELEQVVFPMEALTEAAEIKLREATMSLCLKYDPSFDGIVS